MERQFEEFYFLEAMQLAEGQSLDIADPNTWLEGWFGRSLSLEGATLALRHFEASYRSRGFRVLRDRKSERLLPGMAVSREGESRIIIGCRSEKFSLVELEKARLRKSGGEANYILRVMRRLCGEILPVQEPEQFLGDAEGKILSQFEAEAALKGVVEAYRGIYTQEPPPIIPSASDQKGDWLEFRVDPDQSLIFEMRNLDPDPSDFI